MRCCPQCSMHLVIEAERVNSHYRTSSPVIPITPGSHIHCQSIQLELARYSIPATRPHLLPPNSTHLPTTHHRLPPLHR